MCPSIASTRRVPVQRAVERDEIPYPWKSTTFHILNVYMYVDKTQPHQFKFTYKYNGLRVPQPSSLSHCSQPAVPYHNIMDWPAPAVLVFNGCSLSIAACISTEKTQTRRNLTNIIPKNTTKITDSREYECEDNLRFWWWSLSNCVRTAGKGHICEDSFAYGSYSSIDVGNISFILLKLLHALWYWPFFKRKC